MPYENRHPPTLTLGAGLDQLGTGSISTVPYISEKFFEREQEIWRDAWLMVGREADLAEYGDYATLDIKVLNSFIVITRDRNGALHAFHNVCPHRGGRLIWDRRGRCANIVCRFHGWSFRLDGSLRGRPEPQLFPPLANNGQCNLKDVAVDTWSGFLFVNLNPEPQHNLSEYLSGVPAALNDYLRDDRWRWYTGYQQSFRANWKDLMNIQHEGYHASHIHKKTLSVYFRPEDCRNTVFPQSPGVCSLLTVQRPLASDKLLERMTTVQTLAMRYGTTSNWVEQDTSHAVHELKGAVNHLQSERWVFDCYTFFPNLMLFVGTDVLSVMRVWPLTAHEAGWEWDWFFKDELENFGNLFNREQGRLATRNALTEDWPVCEWVHQNLRAGIVDQIHIASDMEATVRAHYEKLLGHMALREEDLRDDFA